ncbi:MAG: hypothetical protein H6832_01670 [Planctomycetes bacterium]|nr:hypothetical protein [Planctomycetota bacterium]MCB9917095.1 hypothetical protein [Planctomycetota bacterium]
MAPLVTLPVPPFGLGSRFLVVTIPRPATGSAFPLFAQVLHTGPGPVGLYTTQVISIVLGDSESVHTVSSSTTFTGTAQFGPAVGYSSGPVLLLR